MRDYKYILFDLDGTLTDPKEGITKSVAYALKHFGIDVEDLDTLCKFIGPPLKDSFMQYYGLSEDDAHLAVEKYREYFEPCGMFQNKVYDGVENLLKELKQVEKRLFLRPQSRESMHRKYWSIFIWILTFLMWQEVSWMDEE